MWIVAVSSTLVSRDTFVEVDRNERFFKTQERAEKFVNREIPKMKEVGFEEVDSQLENVHKLECEEYIQYYTFRRVLVRE